MHSYALLSLGHQALRSNLSNPSSHYKLYTSTYGLQGHATYPCCLQTFTMAVTARDNWAVAWLGAFKIDNNLTPRLEKPNQIAFEHEPWKLNADAKNTWSVIKLCLDIPCSCYQRANLHRIVPCSKLETVPRLIKSWWNTIPRVALGYLWPCLAGPYIQFRGKLTDAVWLVHVEVAGLVLPIRVNRYSK